MNIRERISKVKNKELIIALVIVMLIIIVKLFPTYAYYGSSDDLFIVKATVGGFAGEGEGVKQGPIDRNTDVNIILYTQMPDNAKKYMISKYVPATGYKVNETVSNCYPAKGSEVTYKDDKYYTIKEDGTVHIEYSESKPTQVVCRIYYDRDKLSDVIIYAYIQDSNGDREYEGDKYRLVNQVEDNYSLLGHKCTNSKVNTDFTYDNGFNIVTDGPNTCYAYFKES